MDTPGKGGVGRVLRRPSVAAKMDAATAGGAQTAILGLYDAERQRVEMRREFGFFATCTSTCKCCYTKKVVLCVIDILSL